jgi:hypothetical protein
MSLTPSQRRVLQNLADAKPAYWGLDSMAAWGALPRTLASLVRRGLITEDEELTPAGREQLTR